MGIKEKPKREMMTSQSDNIDERIANQQKSYSLDEWYEKVEAERRDRLNNGIKVNDFRVYFQKNNLAIQIDRNGEYWYGIDLEYCTNSNDLLYTIFEIHSTQWGQSGGLLSAILQVFDDACQDIHGRAAINLFKAGKIVDWSNPQPLKQ